MNGNALARLSAQPVNELQARTVRLEEQARDKPAQGILHALRMTKAALARALESKATGEAKGHSEKPNKQRYADPFPNLSHGAELQAIGGVFVLSVYRPDNSNPAEVVVSASNQAARRELQGKIFKTLQGAVGACNDYIRKNDGASVDRPLQSTPGELRGSDFSNGGRRVTHNPVHDWDGWI